MENENQRVRLTKMLLKNQLQALLLQKPIGRVSVKELCQGAGVNRSTFYQHYADPYALLGDLEDDIIFRTAEFIGRIGPEKSGRQYLVALMGKEKLTVLIVEDQRLNRQILSALLSRDYTVLEAENGADALDVLACRPEIAAILLDIVMPVMVASGLP